MKAPKRQLAPTGIGLPHDLKEYLSARAKQQFRSLSQEIVMRLSESRERDTKQGAAQ